MKALLLIDIQNDFLPGGALGVPDGDRIIPVINNIQHKFNCIIATRDWHPANHGSFASNHVNKQPGDVIQLNGLTQILWPDHCIQGSPGAELSPLINQSLLSNVIFKGTDPDIDSYSAFYDNGHLKETGLHTYLKRNGITSLYVAGLATDYCVYYTVLDALKLGYATTLITDATKGVNLHPNDSQKAITDMEKRGAQLTTSDQILNQ
jgi:nicotinamidase/pyrazinamidase